jgi:class 3 adenylate cyclase
VQAPTLVLSRTGTDDQSPSRDLADRIPGAQYLKFPGRDHVPEAGNMDEIVDATERFVQSIRAEETQFDRVLATVMFTDIVGSTEKAATLGDAAWKDLIERHHRTVRAMIGRYRGPRDRHRRGRPGKLTAGRAVRCAQAIRQAVLPTGLDVRAGLHTGEVETIDDKVGGIAVMIGARIGAKADPSEVLVSSTVKDLVAGSGLTFEDAGEHELKGIPEQWRLYRVVG